MLDRGGLFASSIELGGHAPGASMRWYPVRRRRACRVQGKVSAAFLCLPHDLHDAEGNARRCHRYGCFCDGQPAYPPVVTFATGGSSSFHLIGEYALRALDVSLSSLFWRFGMLLHCLAFAD